MERENCEESRGIQLASLAESVSSRFGEKDSVPGEKTQKKKREAGRWWRSPVIPVLWEAEAGGFLSQGQPGLQSEFQDSQGYMDKPCLKQEERRKERKERKRMNLR